MKQEADALGEKLLAAGAATKSKSAKHPRDVNPAIGPVAARAVLGWFASDEGRRTLERFAQYGIHPLGEEPSSASASGEGPLKGTTWVLTGALSAPREEIAEEIRQAGGTVSGSVSKKTTYILAGEDAGSKLEKARALEVKVLSEAEFREMVAV